MMKRNRLGLHAFWNSLACLSAMAAVGRGVSALPHLRPPYEETAAEAEQPCTAGVARAR